MSILEYLDPQYFKIITELQTFLKGFSKTITIPSDFTLTIPFGTIVVLPFEVLVYGELFVYGDVLVK